MSNIAHGERSRPQERKQQQRSGSQHLQADRRLLPFTSQKRHVDGNAKWNPNLMLLCQGSCPTGFRWRRGFQAAADGGVGPAGAGIHVSGLQVSEEAAAPAEDAATGVKQRRPHLSTGTQQEEREQPCWCGWVC